MTASKQLQESARLFARLLLKELDSFTLRRLQRREVQQALARIGIEVPDPEDGLIDVLETSFIDVFVESDLAPLVQSHWDVKDSDSPGDLSEECENHEKSSVRKPTQGTPIDHLGIQLLKWAELENKDPEAADEFALKHLRWGKRALEPRGEGDGFYPSLCRSMLSFLRILTESAATRENTPTE